MSEKSNSEKITILLLLVSYLFVLIAIASFNINDPNWFLFTNNIAVSNLEGIVGAWLANFLYFFFGIATWLALLLLPVILFAKWRDANWRPKSSWQAFSIGCFLVLIAVSGLANLYLSDINLSLPKGIGGYFGDLISWYGLELFSKVGTSILLTLVLFSGIIYLDPAIFKSKKKPITKVKVEKKIKQDKYAKPETSMLNKEKAVVTIKENEQELAETLTDKLLDFGIEGKVVAIHPGPVVTRIEFQPAPGVRASKITSLSNDIARSLSKTSVRVVEVIPGKTVVGIEIPNTNREVVTLKKIVESKAFTNAKSPLTIALGSDIAGAPVVANIAKMPHLLVAGTTGAGKSVGLNTMLVSLLYKATPEQLRLLLIDPKMLELSVYEGIPHLLAPVITDMNKAETALKWCVAEMERRYALMAELGVRNLEGYNDKVKNSKLSNPMKVAGDDQPQYLEPMPAIVVLADEFADMMMVVGKQIEQLIARIAQKARAAGIHLILATQRPSVDVITGLIKANIPSRISFQVSSKIDSRTILDQPGADQLLGHGDMLYLPPGTALPIRVHGAYVDDVEVHRIVEELSKNPAPSNQIQLDSWQEDTVSADPSGDCDDELYSQAVEIVLDSKKTSISYVQRRLKIGYNRAASLIEAMEQNGVISSPNHKGQRDILLDN